MHVELILEDPAFDGDSDALEPFRRTSWIIWSKGQMLAVSGHSYRHRKSALAALCAVTGGSVYWETVRGRRQPQGLFAARGGYVPIERVQ